MASLITVRIDKGSSPNLGFRLQGGKDFATPLVIQKVSNNFQGFLHLTLLWNFIFPEYIDKLNVLNHYFCYCLFLEHCLKYLRNLARVELID